MKNHNLYAVIMAGGIGSRFWPASRVNFPKQFLDILGTGKTLIQQTFDRYAQICPPENIFIVTNKDYAELIQEQLPAIDKQQILCEPAMRNTAPCIAYASHKIGTLNPDALIVVAPSDHLILNEQEFAQNVQSALNLAAKKEVLITLGIVPTRPDTGYGYIQYNEKTAAENFFKVKTFCEKPNLELAKTFIQSGDFLWNAGIFIWSVKSILKSFQKHIPEIYTLFSSINPYYNTPAEEEHISRVYAQCSNISIDYAVMEKADNVCVRPGRFGWSDLGTWQSLYDTYSPKDEYGNAFVQSKNITAVEAKNCIINSTVENKLIALQGLEDYIVVDTKDVLLICKRSEEANIKKIMADLKEKGETQYL